MSRFSHSFGLFLCFFISCQARHTVFISHNGEKTYLPSSTATDVCMTPTCVIAAADVLTRLDETVDPCDDFYRFACGGWMKKQEVSKDVPEINVYETTRNDLDRKLKDLLERKYEISDPPFVKMMKDFYNTCSDLDAIERHGSETLKKMLQRLGGGWPVVEGSQWDETSFDWLDTMINFRKLGYSSIPMLDLILIPDPRNMTSNIITLQQPSVRLFYETNRTFEMDDPKVAAYYKMMVKAAKLLGADELAAEKEMLEALNFEIALIEIMNLEAGRVVYMRTIAELQEESPDIPWLKMINGLLLVEEVDENEYIMNSKPDFMDKLGTFITSFDKRVIANYMMWWAVLESKNYLSEEWQKIKVFDEDDKSPQKRTENRWKKCLEKVQLNMGIGLRSYYIRNYFSEESKEEIMILMKYIHKEFLKILEENDWMDESTRKKAQDKANAIKAYIGYPKDLLNDTFVTEIYENLTITTNSYLENILVLQLWNKNKKFSKLRKITNFAEMSISIYEDPIIINAFYDPLANSISIPAGILNEAFYQKDRPNYMNFAVIGSVIGHEITHGFDNNGRSHDKDGREVNWWNKESEEHFIKKTKCIIDQYDNYTTFIGVQVNGELTQNENIADNGGLKEAYLAYHSWTKDHGIEPLLPGVSYNQDQLFWLSAAHEFCAKYEPERLRKLLIMDTHSPAKFRVIGPMSNLPEFSKDFKCSPDAPMNRKYKCEVW